LIGKRWGVDEFQRQAVLLRELPRVGDEEGDVAKTVAVVPLMVDAAWAEPGNPIIPAGTAIVIVPMALAFRNDRRFSTLLVRPVKSWPP
jgi:hypothetical protein